MLFPDPPLREAKTMTVISGRTLSPLTTRCSDSSKAEASGHWGARGRASGRTYWIPVSPPNRPIGDACMTLNSAFLGTLRVEIGDTHFLNDTPAGWRRIDVFRGGSFEGPLL